MRRFDPPEMQTAPLEKLYLDVKHLADQLNRLAVEEKKEQEKRGAGAGPGAEESGDTQPHRGGLRALKSSHPGEGYGARSSVDFIGGSVAEKEAAAIDSKEVLLSVSRCKLLLAQVVHTSGYLQT